MIVSPLSGYLLRESQERQQEARRARYGTGPVSLRGSLTDAYDTVSTRTPDVVFEFGNTASAISEQDTRYAGILSGGAVGVNARSADGLDVQLVPPNEKDKDGNTSSVWRVVVSRRGAVVAHGEITADTRVATNPDGSVTLEEAEDGQTFEGTAGNDILIRLSDRQVNAGTGSDLVISLGGSGGVDGGDGDDVILGSVRGNAASGEGGMALLSGGAGNDRILLDNSLHVLLDGGDGDDTLGGTMAHATVSAGMGDDTLKGEMHLAGIDAGDGNDRFDMKLVAYSQVVAGDGNDVVNGNFLRSTIGGGTGDDTFGGRFRVSTVQGEEGRDTFAGMYERGNVDGGQDGDTFAVDAAHGTEFTGGAGDDVMRASTSFFATYDGGDGNDVLEIGRKRRVGASGDIVSGGPSATAWKVDGLPGDYYAEGDLAHNTVRGGDGDDNLNVYGAPDDRRGLDEPARVSGGRGRDVVTIYGAMQRFGQLYGEEEDGEMPVLLLPYV